MRLLALAGRVFGVQTVVTAQQDVNLTLVQKAISEYCVLKHETEKFYGAIMQHDSDPLERRSCCVAIEDYTHARQNADRSHYEILEEGGLKHGQKFISLFSEYVRRARVIEEIYQSLPHTPPEGKPSLTLASCRP